MNDILYIIIPCYNEETVLPLTCGLFLEELGGLIRQGKVSDDSRILFVNDGSTDATWTIIKRLAAEDRHYIGICQSRNRGHQSAVLAGLMEARGHCDMAISIDCDGQDDIHAIEAMVDGYHAGNDVVYGVRNNRDTDRFFKRFSAECFYKLMKAMGADCLPNHADYRLMSGRVLEAFADFEEVNVYLRGLVPLVGYPSTVVYYRREERMAGKSHYPLKKMLALAADGITSFSVKPIRMVTALGFVISLLSFIGVVWSVIRALTGHTVAGWASLTSILCFVSGIQTLCLGVIGEYVGKTYMETKHRPRYIISERTWDKP